MTNKNGERSVTVSAEAYAMLVRVRAERELRDGKRSPISDIATELIMRGLAH